ncbi:hypothetical protein U9M48_039165 [Paspalum notatum var. saurae]|uniref:Cytochrome b5 heme-binding domain-containing protein n=1 Tax=Paspalum notatum var. saurae TaxID=547442 RepID=A0AAQ3XCX4_PASNO
MEVIMIISFVILLALGALFVIPKSQNKGRPKETDSGVGMTSRSYTKEEISKHSTRKDCWIIIKDKVYDVTPYVEEHPGGDAILNNAGGDSTEGFFGIFAILFPGWPQHGTRVFDIIEDFCIGQLKAS